MSVSVAIGLIILGLFAGVNYSVISFIRHILLYIPVGLAFDLLYKEIARKEQYYFYYNNSISKLQLWISAFLFSFIPYIIFLLCMIVWK